MSKLLKIKTGRDLISTLGSTEFMSFSIKLQRHLWVRTEGSNNSDEGAAVC